MHYINVIKGHRYFFFASLLFILSAILGIASSVVLAISKLPELAENAFFPIAILGGNLATSISFIAALALCLLGSILGKKEEEGFRNSFFAFIASIAFMGLFIGLSFAIADHPLILSALNGLGFLASVVGILFAIESYSIIAEHLRDKRLSEKGKQTMVMMIAFTLLSLILRFLPGLASGNDMLAVSLSFVAIGGNIVMVIVYALFLRFLSQSKEILKQE